MLSYFELDFTVLCPCYLCMQVLQQCREAVIAVAFLALSKLEEKCYVDEHSRCSLWLGGTETAQA